MGPPTGWESSVLWIGAASHCPKRLLMYRLWRSLPCSPELAAAWGEQGSFTLAANEPFTLLHARSQQALELREAGCVWLLGKRQHLTLPFFSP